MVNVMENTGMLDSGAIDRLVEQLAELNRGISGTSRDPGFKSEQWNYLFSFDQARSRNKAEFQRYTFFMKSVTDVLGEFGIHSSNIGYAYIIEAVKIIIDLNTVNICLKTDVYPAIAFKYNLMRSSSVEHNIRNAIRAARRDYDRDPGSNVMGMFGKIPTNKQFLFFVTEEVCLRMRDIMFNSVA